MVLKAQDGIASDRAVLPPEVRMDSKGLTPRACARI